jgi:hypothetical protein
VERPREDGLFFNNLQSIGVGAGAWVLVLVVCGDGAAGAGGFQSSSAHTTLVRLAGCVRECVAGWPCAVSCLRWGKPRGREGFESSELDFAIEIELKSLILAQIERWRHALHMQVERQRGTRATEPWRRAANG